MKLLAAIWRRWPSNWRRICRKSAGDQISAETCTHIFLLRHLESWGFDQAYTYSEEDGYDDFVDQVTQATRLAANNPRFSPLHANRLHKGNLSPTTDANSGSRGDRVAGRRRASKSAQKGTSGSEPHRL